MPPLKPVDESYFNLAPQRFSHTFSIAQPAERVWEELTGERPAHWCRGLRLRWTSAPPFGVGATRQYKLLGGFLVVDEYFFIWEEGRRHALYFTHANLPVLASGAEDFVVKPDGADRCRLTWRVGLTPTPLGRPAAPLNKFAFSQVVRDTSRYFNAV